MAVPKLKPGVDMVQLTSALCARLRDLYKRQENAKQSWGAKIGKLKQKLSDLKREEGKTEQRLKSARAAQSALSALLGTVGRFAKRKRDKAGGAGAQAFEKARAAMKVARIEEELDRIKRQISDKRSELERGERELRNLIGNQQTTRRELDQCAREGKGMPGAAFV